MSDARGFTLVEALLAVTILGIALVGVLPSFMTYTDTNTTNEERTGALSAAQGTLERLRQLDPVTLPTTGATPLQIVTIGNRDYEVVTFFCLQPAFCDADTRHIIVEVSYGGRSVYTLESVFTQLR